MPDEEIVLSGGRLYADDVLLAELNAPSVGQLTHRLAQATVRVRDVRREWWNGPDEYFVLGDNPR